MKVLYCEDLANHESPELCGGDGNITAEALTGDKAENGECQENEVTNEDFDSL